MDIKYLKKIVKEIMQPKSVLLAKPEVITEASYGRIKSKIESQMIPFAMVTAFRGTNSRKENITKQRELEDTVSSAGFPFTKMPSSGYVEEPDDSMQEPVEVKENSILIWDESRPDIPRGELTLFELVQSLASKYGQDSFIFGRPLEDPEGNSEMVIRMYDKNGNKMNQTWAGPWSTLQQVGDDDLFWSTMGSKKAKLVEMQQQYQKMIVKNRAQAMEKQYYLTALKDALKRF
jgi:hypothetical protein